MGLKDICRFKLFIFLAVFFVVFFLSLCTAFGTITPTAKGTVTDAEGVNIRKSYSTSSSKVGAIPQNGTVLITKEKYTSETSYAADTRWYYVESSYGDGWIRADLLAVNYTNYPGKANASANVRKGAGTDFDKVGSVANGDEVQIRLQSIAYNNTTWYKVLYNGSNRYIYAKYVSLDESESTVNINFENELEAFPVTYHSALRILHEEYPTWHFKAKQLSYTWNDALDEQMYSYKINTIPSNRPDSYKAVAKETYNFDGHYYYAMDGSGWVAASRKAVAFYMDPRNWLDKYSIFMFESLLYDDTTQTESMVKELLSSTAIPKSYSSTYIEAGKEYNISPVYLAAKSKLELGPYDDMVCGQKITNSAGKTYPAYNAYNIGASDSATGGAGNGLLYAVDGTTYQRPWNTLKKAIKGGAQFIAEGFIDNNQYTLYYERFNVANRLVDIGTHQYMTNTMAPATQANITFNAYKDNLMLDTAFTFEIPVYKDMPATAAAMPPGKGNNNCYLDSLRVYDGDTRKSFTASFDRFTSTYTLKKSIPYETDKLVIKAVTNADDAKVTVSGNSDFVVGDNKITVKVTSSSGVVMRYYIKLTKSEPTTVIAPEVKISNNASTGKPVLTWEAAPNADKYEVYRSTKKDGEYKRLKTVNGYKFTNTGAVAGKSYYYKVKSVGTDGIIGEAFSEPVYRTCDLPRPIVKASNVASTGKIRLSWDKIEGAKEYVVYRATSKNGTYEKFYTTTGTSFRNTSAKAGKTYYYKVKAISEVKSAANSAYSQYVYRTCDLPRPKVKASNVASTGKIRLSWDKIEGAKAYEIYRATSKNGTYKKLYTTTGASFRNTSAKAGKTYYYKVKAVSKVKSAANSAYSEYVYRTCDLKRPVISVKLSSKGKPRISWDAVDGAKEYVVYRATSKNGTYKRLITTTKTTITNTSAKAGQNYYYKVKAVSEVKSAANSAYSLKKSIKSN